MTTMLPDRGVPLLTRPAQYYNYALREIEVPRLRNKL